AGRGGRQRRVVLPRRRSGRASCNGQRCGREGRKQSKKADGPLGRPPKRLPHRGRMMAYISVQFHPPGRRRGRRCRVSHQLAETLSVNSTRTLVLFVTYRDRTMLLNITCSAWS